MHKEIVYKVFGKLDDLNQLRLGNVFEQLKFQ